MLCHDSECQIVELEKGDPNANRSERYIQMLKTKTDMRETGSLLSFWCYCVEHRAEIINAVTRNNFQVQGQVLHTKMTGQQCAISDICEFKWFKWCLYQTEGRKYPFCSEHLG